MSYSALTIQSNYQSLGRCFLFGVPKRTGEEYGRLRLFGSLGFIIASLLGGSLFSIGPVVPFLIAYALLQIGQIVTANSLRKNFQDTQTTAEAKNLSKTLIKVSWPPIYFIPFI